jgi:DNA transformation protein
MTRASRQDRPLHLLPNVGVVTAARLRAVGIADEAALRRLGALVAYRRVKHAYPRETTIVLLYALHGAITDMPWTALTAEDRTALRRLAGLPAG